MSYLLYLDDVRPIPKGYMGVRSYTEFVSFINHNGLPQLISFDHDLGQEKTGYDCAKWLVDYCLETNYPLPIVIVHSQNPVGKENIQKLLSNFYRHQQSDDLSR